MTWNASTSDYVYQTLATAVYNNGNPVINLPQSVPTTDADIISFNYQPAEGETLIENSLSLSDKTARWVTPVFSVYKATEYQGAVYYEYTNGNIEYFGYHVYADKPTTIKGKYSYKINSSGTVYTAVADMSLKKGWNMLYNKYTDNGNIVEDVLSSTAFPVTLRWKFYYSGDVNDFIKHPVNSNTNKRNTILQIHNKNLH